MDVALGNPVPQDTVTDLRVQVRHDLEVVQAPARRPAGDRPRLALHRSTRALLVAVDVAVIAVPSIFVTSHLTWVALSTVLTVLLFADAGLYRTRLHWSVLDDLPRLMLRQASATAIATIIVVIIGNSPRLRLVLLALVWSAGSTLLARGVLYGVIRQARRLGVLGQRALVLGSGDVAEELVSLFTRHPELGLRPVAYLDERRSPSLEALGLPHEPRLDEVDVAIERHRADALFVAFGTTRDDRISDVARRGRAADCDLYVVPRLFEVMNLDGVRDHVGAVPVVRLRRPQGRGLAPASKRAFDVAVAMVATVAFGPVFLACALAVRTTGPNVIFKQLRVGKDGQQFWLYKFRSMRAADDRLTSTTWGTRGDSRVTAVGRVLRRTSLDELPQLVNVLRGDMTLVGPRPERPHFVEQFSKDFLHYSHRHRVRAGLTGMAQVSGLRGEDSAIDLRARYDNYYIENWTMWLDVKVIVRTVGEVLRESGS